jgi:hypothetical protein
MAQQAIQTLSFDQGDWERVQRDWSAWWEGKLERPLVVMHGYQPSPEPLPRIHFIGANYPAEMAAEEIVDRIYPHLTCCATSATPSPLATVGPYRLASSAQGQPVD